MRTFEKLNCCARPRAFVLHALQQGALFGNLARTPKIVNIIVTIIHPRGNLCAQRSVLL